MRRLMLICLSLCLALLGAETFDMPSVPWFDQVRQPTALTEEQLCDIAVKLRQFLLDGTDAKKLSSLLPNEKTSRVVFITIGGDEWPGRSYYGCGADFLSAVTQAIGFLRANEPKFAEATKILMQEQIDDAIKQKQAVPDAWRERVKHPGAWNWLRLNVVQYSRPTANFSVSHSRIALTSLIGFAFGPNLGFAFLPEQLTGRFMMTETSHIAAQQVCNLISENYNWGAMRLWMNMTGATNAFRICQFETDAYFADASGATRLYRGHTIARTLPTAESCLDLARKNADVLIQCLELKNGKFRPPFPEWVGTDEASESIDMMAELAIALCRLSRECKQPRYAEAARLAMMPVLKRLTESPRNKKQCSFVTEREDLSEDVKFEPRKIVTIHTNALACLALLELAECNVTLKVDAVDTALRICRHIQSQQFGNDFYDAVFAEDCKPYTDSEKTYASTGDTALALLAMHRVQRFKPELNAEKQIQTMLDVILKEKIASVTMEDIPLNPWIMEALSVSERTEKEFMMNLVKVGYASSADMNISPLYPDYYGAIRYRPSCTVSAERTWLQAALCRWLREQNKPTWAAEQLGNCVQMLMFQQQAFIDRGGASSLSNPRQYVGFFRDNLESYGFNLAGQTTQLLSLVAVAHELGSIQVLNGERLLAKIEAVRKETDVHPNALTVDLVFSNKNDVNEKARQLIGETEATVTTGTAEQLRAKKNKSSNKNGTAGSKKGKSSKKSGGKKK